jgi:hypothetical protein
MRNAASTRHALMFVAFAGVIAALAAQPSHASTVAVGAINCSNSAAPPTLAGKPLNLTGIYSWRRGTVAGTFYLRQAGTCLYMMGQSNRDANGPPGRGFTTIFIGGIASNLTVSGLWSDVPYGQVTGHGTLVWKIREVKHKLTLNAVRSTGDWGATEIVRQKSVSVEG